jgi:hypothetical protein
MCIYIYIYIYIYTCIYIYNYICTPVHIHICVWYAHPTCALSPGKRCQEHMGRAGLKSCQPHSILFTPPTSRAVTLSSGGAFEATKRRWPADRLQR